MQTRGEEITCYVNLTIRVFQILAIVSLLYLYKLYIYSTFFSSSSV